MGEERTWTDVTGKFSVTAELVEVRGDKVVLRRQNGKQITVLLADCEIKEFIGTDYAFRIFVDKPVWSQVLDRTE